MGKVLTADRYVLAFGSYSRDFLKPLDLQLPVYPVKGYSLTIPIVDPAFARNLPCLMKPTKLRLLVLTNVFA